MSKQVWKITYHGEKKINSYLKLNTIQDIGQLQNEILNHLYDVLKQPRRSVRIYWIDIDGDEIDLNNQNDFDILMIKNSNHLHLQIALVDSSVDGGDAATKAAPINVSAAPKATESTPTAGPDTDPADFVIHDNVECDACGAAPIIGFRYKCIQCPNFDLCQKCEAQHKHAQHMLVRMPTNHCPSVIEAWVSGCAAGGGKRRGGKRAKGHCPFAANDFCGTSVPTMASSAAPSTCAPEPAAGERHHHGRRHQRRQMRHGFLAHLYDMMHDLAEGGGAAESDTAAEAGQKATNEANMAAANATHDAQKAAEHAIREANKAAENATREANKAAEAAAQEAQKVADEAQKAAKKAAQAAINAVFGPPPKTNENAFVKTTTTNTSATAPRTPPSTPNAATADAPPQTHMGNENEATTPVLNFDGLAQIVHPQYMKAGIEILNNFSEMFAKMLDPVDGAADLSTPVSDTRKNSTASSTTSNVSSSTSNSASVATKNTTQNENVQEKTAPATAGSTEFSTPHVSVLTTPLDDNEHRRRSQSDDGDWQVIDNQSANFADASNSTTSEMAIDSAAVASTTVESVTAQTNGSVQHIDYRQLGQDLRAHIAQEEQREQAVAAVAATQTTATTAVNNETQTPQVSLISTTVEATTNTTQEQQQQQQPPAPEEKRAVPVYHVDHRINNAVHAMMAMGFSNEGAWLTQLLASVNGNIAEALDLMSVTQRNNN